MNVMKKKQKNMSMNIIMTMNTNMSIITIMTMKNKETFYSAVLNPSSLTPEDVDALAAAVRQYPFFHAGWMLLAKHRITGSNWQP